MSVRMASIRSGTGVKMEECEAKTMLEAYLKCQKRQTSGVDTDCNNNMCDNCELCYAQGTNGEHEECVKIAIKALEKQIPKKALNKKDALFANCPNCGRVQNSVWNKTYCGDCGKKLDWSD